MPIVPTSHPVYDAGSLARDTSASPGPDSLGRGSGRRGVRFIASAQYGTCRLSFRQSSITNSAELALSRFTSCILMSGIELPYAAIRASIAEALSLVLHIERRKSQRFVSEVLRIKRYLPAEDRCTSSSACFGGSRVMERHTASNYVKDSAKCGLAIGTRVWARAKSRLRSLQDAKEVGRPAFTMAEKNRNPSTVRTELTHRRPFNVSCCFEDYAKSNKRARRLCRLSMKHYAPLTSSAIECWPTFSTVCQTSSLITLLDLGDPSQVLSRAARFLQIRILLKHPLEDTTSAERRASRLASQN